MARGRLVAIQCETCHANSDGTAWYAYFDGPVEPSRQVGVVVKLAVTGDKSDHSPLGLEWDEDAWEEVPNALSKHTGLRRYYAGAAV